MDGEKVSSPSRTCIFVVVIQLYAGTINVDCFGTNSFEE